MNKKDRGRTILMLGAGVGVGIVAIGIGKAIADTGNGNGGNGNGNGTGVDVITFDPQRTSGTVNDPIPFTCHTRDRNGNPVGDITIYAIINNVARNIGRSNAQGQFDGTLVFTGAGQYTVWLSNNQSGV